jgi:hypothetical protein
MAGSLQIGISASFTDAVVLETAGLRQWMSLRGLADSLFIILAVWARSATAAEARL